jgi:hypothetical protein
MRSLQRSLLSSLAFAGLIALGAGCAEEKAFLPIVRDAATAMPAADAGKPADGGAAKTDSGNGSTAACAGDTAVAGDQCGGFHCKETADDIDGAKSDDAKCGSEADIAALCSNEAPAITATCGMTSGYDGPMTKTCVMGMLEDMSGECVDCFVESMLCTVGNCATACAAGANSAACVTCRKDNDCFSDFYECAGLKSPHAS